VAEAPGCVWGYAVALDMTRRDLQAVAKKLARPWEVAKAFARSAPIGPAVPAAEAGDLRAGPVTLAVNGEVRQAGDLAQMIWSVPEIIAELSRFFELAPGDVILTGTPAGVGAIQRGDALEARIGALPPLIARVA
jgi:fumarylpyruvate hydrolase